MASPVASTNVVMSGAETTAGSILSRCATSGISEPIVFAHVQIARMVKPTTSAKWKAMQRESRVGWVIDGGTRGHYKGASMRGRAEEVRDPSGRARAYEALRQKYFGAADAAEFVNIFGQVDDPESVYVRLVPDAALTWEY